MSSFVFPGYPAYLAAAAEQLDRPKSVRGAGRLVALTALANLCAQATLAEPGAVDAILLKATEFRDELAVALRAAEAMLVDVWATQPDLDAAREAASHVASPANRNPPRRAGKGGMA